MTPEDGWDGLASVFREVSYALLRADSRAELESAVCETLTRWDPYRFAWVGTFDEAADEVVPQAAAGEGNGYLDEVTIDPALELTGTVRGLVETILEGSGATTAVPLARVLDRELDGVSTEHEGVVVERATTVPHVSVRADDMLGSVFRNVLNNAARHADAEPVRIAVGVAEGDDAVTVRIADNGKGIPDDRKEAVFGKGERGLDSDGTGIDLYLVNVLVEGYGGDVWIEDAEPTGAAVHVRLPKAG